MPSRKRGGGFRPFGMVFRSNVHGRSVPGRGYCPNVGGHAGVTTCPDRWTQDRRTDRPDPRTRRAGRADRARSRPGARPARPHRCRVRRDGGRDVLAGAPDGRHLALRLWLADLEPRPRCSSSSAAPIAPGWHRAFCLKLTRWRGTREIPALMMALDRGGSCTGLAYRLPEGDRLEQIERLLRRETDSVPATNVARWINVSAGGETITRPGLRRSTRWRRLCGRQLARSNRRDHRPRRRPLGLGGRPISSAPSASSRSMAFATATSGRCSASSAREIILMSTPAE